MCAVVIMPRARRQIVRAAEWWDQHRDKAPEAFDDDLSAAFAQIAENAGIGAIVRRGLRPIRRIFARRIHYYVYDRLRNETLEVISIWHSSRRPPQV